MVQLSKAVDAFLVLPVDANSFLLLQHQWKSHNEVRLVVMDMRSEQQSMKHTSITAAPVWNVLFFLCRSRLSPWSSRSVGDVHCQKKSSTETPQIDVSTPIPKLAPASRNAAERQPDGRYTMATGDADNPNAGCIFAQRKHKTCTVRPCMLRCISVEALFSLLQLQYLPL